MYYKVFGPSSLSQKRDAHITKILDFYQTNRKQLNFTFQNIMNKATCFYVKLNSVGMNNVLPSIASWDILSLMYRNDLKFLCMSEIKLCLWPWISWSILYQMQKIMTVLESSWRADFKTVPTFSIWWRITRVIQGLIQSSISDMHVCIYISLFLPVTHPIVNLQTENFWNVVFRCHIHLLLDWQHNLPLPTNRMPDICLWHEETS